jgi:hypothetical protein
LGLLIYVEKKLVSKINELELDKLDQNLHKNQSSFSCLNFVKTFNLLYVIKEISVNDFDISFAYNNEIKLLKKKCFEREKEKIKRNILIEEERIRNRRSYNATERNNVLKNNSFPSGEHLSNIEVENKDNYNENTEVFDENDFE